ncbi:hypothetical protein C8R46DRAFT_1231284 [Mycena filopes]|nr:hypothetical protein C8R46DRAFT_1231284 [Mycena filopes]
MHSLILVLFVSSNVRATLHRRLNSQLANSMKEPVYQARRAHAGRKEPVRQQCDRARTVDRTRTPLRRSPRFLKPALLVDPPAPESEENGDRTSSEVVLASKREGSTHSGPPLRPVPPFADPQLQGNNDHPGSVETMLVDPAVGDEGHLAQLDDDMELPELLYPEMRTVKESFAAAFEVIRVCYFCLVTKDTPAATFTNAIPEELAFHLRTVHHFLERTSNMTQIEFAQVELTF